MRIFLSWSGARSERVALALQDWLPKVVQAVRPWLSSADIDAGRRWTDEVAHALEGIHFGIVCLTSENVQAPWVLFECGALAKAVSQYRIIPYLVGIESQELKGPLAQFQNVCADKEGTFKLVAAVNSAAGDSGLSAAALADVFGVWWPRLEAQIDEARRQPVRTLSPPRSMEDMVAEILSIVRGFERDPDDDPSPGILRQPSANNIRAQRLYRGLTTGDLARVANLSTETIRRAETGHPISGVSAARIARALGMSVEEVFGTILVAPPNAS
jgi:DNA-binding XRE family transcriptional regulator